MDIGNLIAMIASAALQKRAVDKAANNTQNAVQQAQQRQLLAQDEATQAAMRRAAQYEPVARQAAQDQLQQQLVGQYDRQATAPAITAQGVQVGATLPEGAGGADYLAARAREQKKALESSRALAQLMGRIGATSELRRGEAVGLGDTAQEIGRIQTGAINRAGADQLAIEQAGTMPLAPMIAGAALRGYGMSGLSQSGLKKQQPAFGEYGTASGPSGGWL